MLNWIALIVLLLIGVGAIGFMAYGPANTWRALYGSPDLGPFDLATLQRASRPNDALFCTPGACPSGLEVSGELPAYDLEPEALLTLLQDAIMALPGTKDLADGNAAAGSIRIITWTPSLGFPDTNQFWAVKLPDGKTGLVAYARAQIGYSDTGNNARRLREWTALLESETGN
ncbi:MAG: DUF1499 domain-containing protein [Pseudomonadota bacterium]